MAYMSEPYRNATAIANHLMDLILTSKADSRTCSFLVREWREIEQMKREWRGLPRLSPVSVKELMDTKSRRLKEAATIEVCTEADDLPVTAPPTP